MKLSLKTITGFAKKNALALLLGILLVACMFSPPSNLITETFKEGAGTMRKHGKKKCKCGETGCKKCEKKKQKTNKGN